MTTALYSKYKNKWQHLLLFLSGLAILVIHIHSTSVVALSDTRGCLLEVRPWLATLYTCVALEINCANGEYDGGADSAALEAVTENIVPSALKSLIFASCARLNVPAFIQKLPGLQMIKIYNSTVVGWDATAELRRDLHPDLQLLYISDSNFSGSGDLPIGLLGDDFPPTLVDVEFSGTNVVELPSNLPEKWTKIQFFVFERNAKITEFPSVLLRMKIPELYLNCNGIVLIPNGLLVDQAFWTLSLSGNPLVSLPDTIGDLSGLYRVGATHTNVSSLPAWTTEVQYDAASGEPVIPSQQIAQFLTGGTPLCEVLEKREAATKAKLAWVDLDCSVGVADYVYPIDEERQWRAVSLTNMS